MCSQSYGADRDKISITLPDIEPVLPRAYGKLNSEMIPESSGLAKSRVHDDVFWTHNDSGDSARLFAFDSKGHLIKPPRTISYKGIAVLGALNVDWEDIASDDKGSLFIGDIGNNKRNKKLFIIYKINEPSPSEDIAVIVEQTINIYYPGEEESSLGLEHINAEAMFWAKNHLLIITKAGRSRYSRLYALSLENLVNENPLTLISSFDFKGMVTGADASADGSRVAVLTYNGIWLFSMEENSLNFFTGDIRWLPIRAGQCEAICFDGNSLVISNEQGRIYKIQIDNLIPLEKH
jgi:hypothetical protein